MDIYRTTAKTQAHRNLKQLVAYRAKNREEWINGHMLVPRLFFLLCSDQRTGLEVAQPTFRIDLSASVDPFTKNPPRYAHKTT